MDDPKKIAKGDAVKVYDINPERRGQPDGGWDGTIVRIGRKLVHIEYPGWPSDRHPQAFDIVRQVASDGYGQQSYKTLAQAALDDREARAMAVLREAGLGLLRAGVMPTLEQLEAAADGIQRGARPLLEVDASSAAYDPMAED